MVTRSNRQQRPLLYDFRRSLLRVVRNCICASLDYGCTNIGQRPIYHKIKATQKSGLFRVLCYVLPMPAKAKIDNEVFLELASKGLTQTEIARYFDVQPSSIRSKAMTLSKVHPDVLRLISTPTAEKQQNIDTRLSLTLDRYMLESSNIQKHLAKLPTEPSLDHLDQRSTIILKGLQILEKIQKISNPQSQDTPRTLNVTHISNVLSSPSAKDQDTQVLEG